MRQGSSNGGIDRREFLKTSGAAALVGSLAGCVEGIGGSDEGGLQIGFYGPFTGPASNIGEQKQNAAELARDMINEDGGVHGEDIELVFGDSESEPSSGRNEVNRLINDEGVDIIGGGFHSDVALTTIEVTNQYEVPQVIDEAVSSQIVEKINENEFWNVFKTAPPSEAYAVGWRQLIEDFQDQELGYFSFENQEIALIGEDTSYGLSVMEMMEEQMAQIDWEVTSADEVSLDETDFTSLLSRLEDDDPDIVWGVQTSSSGAGNLAQQFAETGFEETHFFHNYGLTIEEARETAGDAVNGAVTMLNAGRVDSLLKEQGVLSAWNDRYDIQMTGSSALSYQNVKAIAEYVRAFDSLEAFRSAGVSEWRETVLNHEPIKGGTGYIEFEDNHQAAWGSPDTQPALGYQVVDQDLNFVWPSKLSSADFDESFY